MSSNWKFPTRDSVLAIHEQVLAAHGGLSGVRDPNLLESAIEAPQASMFGKPIFDEPVEIAAAFLFYLCKNHPFLDGNKRTALATTLVFLHENGNLPDLKTPSRDIDAWEALVLDVAAGKINRETTTERLRSLVEPI